MISSPSKSSQFGMIRRTQSTDIEWSNNFNHPNNDSAASDRLDSIFRSRPKAAMSPIGTRKLLPASSVDTEGDHDGVPSIRPSLSCPAAVFESPLRNLLEQPPSFAAMRDERIPDHSIEFDDEASAISEAEETHDRPIVTDAELLSAAATTTTAAADESSFPRNLNNAFDLLVPQTTTTISNDKQCRYHPPSMITIEHTAVPRIILPSFTLSPLLSGSLSPAVISRVSFCSVVRDINAEADVCHSTDPTSNGRVAVDSDGRVHVHPGEETSVLLGGGNEAAVFSNTATLLDEEWFLLSAIASREQWEVEANGEALLPTFAEAMGETKEESAAGSRTQLWKPGRSWWEAKSGKNPWVEPVVHNNRWRYLWPLIHYHKFIAKCIKKLKRNGVDVKTSSSTVSVFLRQEVCHISDHLAFMSKYDSEEWTNALRNFDGWVDHDSETEATVRNLVLCQRLVGQEGTEDVHSSLLQSQLDQTVLKAMQAVREEAAKAAASENYDYGKGCHGGNGKNEEDCASQNSFNFHGKNRSIQRSWSGSTGNPQSATKSKRSGGREGNWREEYPTYHHQGMYGPHAYERPPPPHYSHSYGPTIEPQYYHHYPPPPHHHPHMGYHHGGDMPYGHPPPYYNGYYDSNFHDGMVLDTSMQSESYVDPSAMATPSRYHPGNHPQPYPMSPFHHDYWGHLNISQLPGLAPSPSMSTHTPSRPPRGNSNRSFRKRQQGRGKNPAIDGKAKSLIIFPKQANSPASRFVMSPQDKSNPYYSAHNFQSSNLNQSNTQEDSFVLPNIEDFHSPMKQAEQSPYYTESRNDKVEVGQSLED